MLDKYVESIVAGYHRGLGIVTGPFVVGSTRTLRLTILSGAVFAACGLAFQNGPPNQPGAAQGASFSSGAPANTAVKQGAFTSSGAPAGTAGQQSSVAAKAADPSFAPLLADPEAKLAAIAAAAQAGDPQELRQYLKDTDPAIQGAAFEALLTTDPGTAAQDLLALIRDTGELTRKQALQLLANSPGVDEDTIRAALLSAAVDRDPLVRQYAIETLAMQDAEDAASRNGPAGPSQGPFKSSGGTANTAGPQGSFLSSGAAANAGGPQANPQATGTPPAWTLQNTETKLAAVEDAANARDVETLRTYVGDADPAVQRAAFDALFVQDEAAAIQGLLSIIRDSSQVTRLQTLQLLNTAPQIDDQTVRAALASAVSDPDALVSTYATAALAARNAAP